MNSPALSRRLLVLIVAALLLVPALSGISLAQESEAPYIYLQNAIFDPLRSEPKGAGPESQGVRPASETYILQFNGPVVEEWKTAVEAAGVRLYGYVPDFAFIARPSTPQALSEAAQLPFVRWVGPYLAEYRLSPALQGLQTLEAAPQAAKMVELLAQTLPDADLASLQGSVQSLGGEVISEATNEVAGYLRLRLPAPALEGFAAQEGVLWVEPYVEMSTFNNESGSKIMKADTVRASLGLYGSGQIVAVSDTGLDSGSQSTLHLDVRGRLVKAYCLGRPSPCDWSDPEAHGTHVAGSVLGNGSASGSTPLSHQYGTSFAGVAPEARLVFQSLTDSSGRFYGIPTDIGNLMRWAYADGARIHTNSWGGPTTYPGNTSNTYGAYVISSQQVDMVTWQNKDLLVLFAAGNSGVDSDANGVVDADSIAQPATAKNAFTVGASENNRPDRTIRWGQGWPSYFPANPIFNDYVANNPNGMAAFSSRGPTDDGRIKPDIVAPGTFIVSMRSSASTLTGWGAYNNNYLYMGGTSMATPLTAGAAALVREWLTRVQNLASPSAALMKALLINGAANMSPGQYSNPQEVPSQRPNGVSGWGRVNLEMSLVPPAPNKLWLKDVTSGIKTGQKHTYHFTVTAGSALTAAGEEAGWQGVEPGSETPEPPAMAPAVEPLQAGAPNFTPLEAQPFEPLGTVQVLQNTGFETGAWSPWQTQGGPALTTAQRHNGSWSARLGGSTSSEDFVLQTVNIPANASNVSLSFWYKSMTQETVEDADFLCMAFWPSSGGQPLVGACLDFALTGNKDWTQAGYTLTADDLSKVAGLSGYYGIYVYNDISDASQVWIDDTALNVTTPDGVPTVTPTATQTPTAGGPLRFTLAWTDYPSGVVGTGKTLVNNLDLEIIGPDGTRYYGNQGAAAGNCLRDGKWDSCNNIEGIILSNAKSGVYTLNVYGYNVPQGSQQPYALVGSGVNLREGTLNNRLYLPLMRR